VQVIPLALVDPLAQQVRRLIGLLVAAEVAERPVAGEFLLDVEERG